LIDCPGETSIDGDTPRTAAIASTSLGAAAYAEPATMVVCVFPPAVRVITWHPVAP